MRESGWSARTSTRCSTIRYAESSTVAGQRARVAGHGQPRVATWCAGPATRRGGRPSVPAPARRRRPAAGRRSRACRRGSRGCRSRSTRTGPWRSSGSRSLPDSAAVVSWPSRSCRSPSSCWESRTRSLGDLQRDPLVAQLLELDGARLELARSAQCGGGPRGRCRRRSARSAARARSARSRWSRRRTRTAAVSSVARPREIHACLRSRATAPR